MSIVVSREPQDISLSKNPIIYHLQSDARVDNPGTAAVNRVKFSGTIAEGTVVVLRWKGTEQRMVAKTTPQLLGFEFPAGIVNEAYMGAILPYFRDNYYIDQDFEVQAWSGSQYYLEFTARQPGSTYNFIAQNIPSVTVQVPTPGVNRKIKPNFCIYAEAWVEKADGSSFEKIFGESLQVDESGKTEWNLSDLLHPELSPDIHDWEGKQFNQDTSSKRRYYIRYAEAWGERFQIGKITKGETKHVVLGGTPYESGSTVTITDVVQETAGRDRDRALRLGPDVRYVYPDEPQFLTFLNTRDTPLTLPSLKVVAKLAAGGESQALSIELGSPLMAYSRATVNVGYQQLSLNELGGGNAIESYTVQLFNGLIPAAASRPYTFVLKYEYKPYRRYFVYLNSLGALDTMHTWGRGSQEIELTRRSAEKFLSPDFKFTDGTFSDWDIQYRQRFEASTGYRHPAEIRQLRDFYISRYKFRKFANKALPISVISNTLKEYEDGSSLIAQSFEYAYNFEDDTWSEQEDTPDQYAPPPGFQGAAGAPIVIKVPPPPGLGPNGNLLYDLVPKPGSHNLIKSGDLYKIIQNLQEKLAKGVLGQYIRGDHTLGNLVSDVTQVVDNKLPVFKEEEFPAWLQPESSSARIAADESIDPTPGGGGGVQSGFYHTPSTSKENGWPVDGKKASLIRVVNGEPGSQAGSDVVVTSDGRTYVRTIDNQAGNGEWTEVGINAKHPEFTNIPRITVPKNEQFVKYLDLALYKTSYHTLSNLSVEINYNSLKSKGLEIIKDGLLLTFSGKFLDDISIDQDNILVYVTDQNGNQTTLSIRIGSFTTQPEEPEEPVDNRPACPIGPDFYGEPEVLSPSSIKFGFHGVGVPDIRIKIYVPGVSIPIRGKDNDLIAYNNDTAIRTITFDPLPPGEYDMSIEGSLCKSEPDIKRIVIANTPSSLTWSAGYPLHQGVGFDSEFRMKVEGSESLAGSYLTEVINMTTGVTVHSAYHEYIPGLSIVTVPKTGGWPDATYKINVGELTATIVVGTPVEPPSSIFRLVKSWNGAVIADLNQGSYTGSVPTNEGFNIYFQSSQLGFSYNYCEYYMMYEVSAGTWQSIPNTGGAFSVGSGTSSTVLNPLRMFSQAGLDSRFVQWNGQSLNRYGKFRAVYIFKSGGAGGTVAGNFQQTFQFNELKINGGWGNTAPPNARVVPVVGGVRYNGVNVVTSNVWAEPWNSYPSGTPKLQFSLDKVTWYGTSAFFDGFGTATESCVLLLNTPSQSAIDLFPPGTNKTVYLRDGLNTDVVSPGFVINQGSAQSGTLSAKTVTQGYEPHMELEVTKEGSGWRIKDKTTFSPPGGKHFWYLLNSELHVQDTPLDYLYNSNKPLGVYKLQIKDGVTDLWPWHGAMGSDETIGEPFSNNCSVAFQQLIFNKK